MPFIIEANGSVTLEIDLGRYVEVFRKMNQKAPPASEEVQEEYTQLITKIIDKYTKIGGSALAMEWMREAFQCYPKNIQSEIMLSPVYTLLSDSVVELIKNTIDSFLEHQLKNPTESTTKILLNFQAEVTKDQVLFTFSDTGTGFDEQDDLPKWSTEESQMEYIQQRKYSKKSGIVGLLGGGGFGIRHLIHQILIAKEFTADSSFIRPENFESSIRFSNGTGDFPGARIQIMTQKEPFEHDPELIERFASPQTTIESRSVSSGFSQANATPSPDIDPKIKLRTSSGLSIDIPLVHIPSAQFSPIIKKSGLFKEQQPTEKNQTKDVSSTRHQKK
jgi:hypothetical protein